MLMIVTRNFDDVSIGPIRDGKLHFACFCWCSLIFRVCKQQQTVKGKHLQVCFLIDATSSMQRLIDSVRSKIVEILNQLKAQHELRLEVAVVAYRDTTEEPDHDCEMLPFTLDVAAAEAFLAKLRAFGRRGGRPVLGFMKPAGWSGTAILKSYAQSFTSPMRQIMAACSTGRTWTTKYADNDGALTMSSMTEIARKEIDFYFGD